MLVLRYSGLGKRQSARLTSVRTYLEKSASISEDDMLAISRRGDGACFINKRMQVLSQVTLRGDAIEVDTSVGRVA